MGSYGGRESRTDTHNICVGGYTWLGFTFILFLSWWNVYGCLTKATSLCTPKFCQVSRWCQHLWIPHFVAWDKYIRCWCVLPGDIVFSQWFVVQHRIHVAVCWLFTHKIFRKTCELAVTLLPEFFTWYIFIHLYYKAANIDKTAQ